MKEWSRRLFRSWATQIPRCAITSRRIKVHLLVSFIRSFLRTKTTASWWWRSKANFCSTSYRFKTLAKTRLQNTTSRPSCPSIRLTCLQLDASAHSTTSRWMVVSLRFLWATMDQTWTPTSPHESILAHLMARAHWIWIWVVWQPHREGYK